MRLSLALLLVSLLGALGGAWLIGQWAVGIVVLAYSVLLATFAVLRDPDAPTVTDLEPGTTEEDRFRRQVTADLGSRLSGRSA